MHRRLLAVLLLLPMLQPANARPEFADNLPNGNASLSPNSGITCAHLGHEGCIPPMNNQFGLDFKSAGYSWTKELCMKDSDGDGLTNGEELGDPCCAWTKGGMNGPAREVGLSHPGDASQRAVGNPTCFELIAAPATTTSLPTAGDGAPPAGAVMSTSPSVSPSSTIDPTTTMPAGDGATAAVAATTTPSYASGTSATADRLCFPRTRIVSRKVVVGVGELIVVLVPPMR